MEFIEMVQERDYSFSFKLPVSGAGSSQPQESEQGG